MEQVNLWQEISSVLGEMLQRILLWTRETVFAHAPGFLSALLVLLLGWVAASVIRNIAAKVLRAGGVDVIAERSGLRAYLLRHDVKLAPSAILGRMIYYVIIFTAVVMAVDRLQFETAAYWLHSVAEFLPRLLVVVLLLALASWSARWIGSLVGRAARLGGVPFYAVIGTLVRVGLIVTALVVGLDFLELATPQTMLITLAVTFIAGLFTLGIFAVCARELVGSILTKSFVASEYKPGDRIQLGDLEGEVESIGATVIRVRSPRGLTLVPHGRLLRETVDIADRPTSGNKSS